MKQQLRLYADSTWRDRTESTFLAVGAAPILALLPDARGDEDKPVRWAAAMLLGEPELYDEDAVDALCGMLRDKYPSVRTAAALSLRSERAVGPLLQVLEAARDTKVIRTVAEALRDIGDARAIEPIEALLGSWMLEKRNPPYMIRNFQQILERLKNPHPHDEKPAST